MSNHNQLLQLAPLRIEKILVLLHQQCWTAPQHLQALGGPTNPRPVPLSQGKRQTLRPVKPGDYFGPTDKQDHRKDRNAWQQRWFRVDFPASRPDERGRRYFHWDCRGEHIVYYQEKPWSGIDVAHLYCKMPDAAGTFWIDCGTYQSCIWFPGKTPDQYGFRFDGTWTACRNLLAWETYWDWEGLVDLARQLLRAIKWEGGHAWEFKPQFEECTPLLRRLLGDMDRACDLYESADDLAAFARQVKSLYRRFPAEPWNLNGVSVGHSHLDLVWNWPEGEGRRKGIHTAASMLRLLDEYPDFKYMWTQPALYRVLEEREPEMFAQIRKQIRAKRWEASGAMWVEADNTLPSGEALARCLYLGQRYFKKLTGAYSTVLFLPDVFGYTACLPKLLSLAGVRGFYTGKLNWCNITRFPYKSFVWRSPGGGEVVAHLHATQESHYQADVHPEVFSFVGVGDGGGGTRHEDIERLRRRRNLAGSPRQSWGSVESFFARLDRARDRLPVYEGELYLEYHRGTYTTQGQFKYQYRRAEKALQAFEAVAAALGRRTVPHAQWERVCFAQFHDAIPGSSIRVFYDEMTPELEGIADQALADATGELSSKTGAPAVFNPVAAPRRLVVDRPGGRSPVLVEAPGLSGVTLDEAVDCSDTPWQVSPGSLDNGRVRAAFNAQGQLTQLTVDNEPLLAAPCRFVVYPDNPAAFDSWDLDLCTVRLSGDTATPSPLQVRESGPVRAKLSASGPLGQKSTMTVTYILEHGSPWLKVELDIDWHEDHRLCRLVCPTLFAGAQARYGIPFGSILRAQAPGELKAEAQWEVPASRWAAALDDTQRRGMALITESKYGFSCRSGVLTLSLLRAPKEQDPQADMGRHIIRFALGKFAACATPEQENPALAADTLYAPAIPYRGRPVAAPFTLEGGGSLIATAVLPAFDGKGYVMRLSETMGLAGSATVRFHRPVRAISQVDLLERPLGKIKVAGEVCTVEYKAFDLISLKVIGG